MSHFFYKHSAAILAIWLFFGGIAFAQTASPKQYTDDEIANLIQDRIKELDATRDVDDAAKTKLREQYQQAQREMEAAKTWAGKAAYFRRQVADAPNELRQTKTLLSTQPNQAAPPIPDNLAQATADQEAELAKLRTQLSEQEAELKPRVTRRVEIPKLGTTARDKLNELNAELQTPAASDDNSPATAARRILLLARRRSLEQELLSYDAELKTFEALGELLPLRRDLTARRVATAEQRLRQLQDIASQRRKLEADHQAQQASSEARQAPLALKRAADENEQLAEERKNLVPCIADAAQQWERVKQELDDLKKRAESLRKKVGNSSSVVVALLRKESETLPDMHDHRQTITVMQSRLSESELRWLELTDARSQLADLDAKVRESLAHLNWAQDDGRHGELAAQVRDALQTKRQYLDDLINDYSDYLVKLAGLGDAETQLLKTTEDYAAYIKEQVFWIASTMRLDVRDIRRAGEGLLWLAGPNALLDLGRTLAADAQRAPVVPALALLCLLALSYWHLRFRGKLQEIGDKAARGSCYHFWPTLEALLLTFMVSVLRPGILGYVGWRLTAANAASDLCKAVGAGLIATAQIHLLLEFLRHTCGNQGLGDAHFAWPTNAVRSLRYNFHWISLAMVPVVFIAVAMSANTLWDSSLGRISFIASLLLTAVFLQRVLRPRGSVMQAVLAEHHGGWFDRFRYPGYVIGVLTPLTLAIMAGLGYYYTAQQLAQRLATTAYVLVGLILLRSVLLRWTVVSQRRLAIEQARQRRTAAQNEIPLGEEAPVAPAVAAAKPGHDLPTITNQTRRLVGYVLTLVALLGIWGTWVDVLPALRILNQFQLWQNDDQWITLANLLLSSVILATTFIAAKNLPGLLEMAISQYLPVDAGARYALATVSRYLITIVGMVAGFQAIGIGWSKVQWLVAAMSLGLGFGLQEIFANFISGLIILFERPVRVGDVITIDSVTGVVSRIHLRTTTITDWDRKELIIPNKEFITGRVLNWTLSDPVNRVVINVGVAYGSDTQRAAEILQKIAQDHPNVLDDPAPRVTLESFGDSALNFVVRCFLPNLENRITVIHELHMTIERRLREAGIEIAFPQHDIHVRTFNGAAWPATGPFVSWPTGENAPSEQDLARDAA